MEWRTSRDEGYPTLDGQRQMEQVPPRAGRRRAKGASQGHWGCQGGASRAAGRGTLGGSVCSRMRSFVTREPSPVTASLRSSEICTYTLLWKGRESVESEQPSTDDRFAHKKERETWGNRHLATCAWNKR